MDSSQREGYLKNCSKKLYFETTKLVINQHIVISIPLKRPKEIIFWCFILIGRHFGLQKTSRLVKQIFHARLNLCYTHYFQITILGF